MSGDFSDITRAFDNARVRLAGPADTGDYSALGRHFVVDGQLQAIEVPEPRDQGDGITDADIAAEMREGMGLKPAAPQMILTSDSAARKRMPLFRGLIKYFPRALAAVAQLSYDANEKHNPGEPLHWSENKSNDHLDAATRHLFDAGTIDPEFGFYHDVGLAWRALANLETLLKQQETK
jgi:hypothetical protein